MENLAIYKHNNERGVLIATQATNEFGNVIKQFIPLSNKEVMEKVLSGEIKCELSYEDIHDNYNTYGGEKEIIVAVVLDRTESNHLISAWVTQEYKDKDYTYRNLYLLTTNTDKFCSIRRFMVDKIIKDLVNEPNENEWDKIQAKLENEWIEMVKQYKGDINDTQLQFTELMDEALLTHINID